MSSGSDSGGQGKNHGIVVVYSREGQTGTRKGGKGDKDGVEGKDADNLCVCVYCVWKSGGRGEAWLSEREVSWGNGRWESQEGWWRGQPGEGVCRTHEHGVFSPTSADNDIGAAGAKDLSVALRNCPNLHTLNLQGE